jgi:hypothetical protein
MSEASRGFDPLPESCTCVVGATQLNQRFGEATVAIALVLV